MKGWSHRHREPPNPDADLHELLLYAAHQTRRAWAQSLEEWGLSPHQAMALRTAMADDGGRVSDLAARLRIAPRSATEVVDTLEERGLIERVRSPEDRRAVLVQVTDDGRGLVEHIERARDEAQRTMFDRLSPDDQDELRRLLRTLIDTG
ncbi:MarR family winged helix-turn-helix transcriptional regulator [Ruania halotolerans]|uniref:MarR family winged helix-turn-helix transcriptional regulator n=1 Tax=Ruania halotolerans TaxID=2897773 RepID=UPI001E4C2740|nr:MarR family transcriptional regulator [Ruania halotolerans]UFU07187.1 MarR family transcriptional regulator [Ruania halotolerans]